MKYAIMFERVELKAKVHPQDIIDEYTSEGMLNSSTVKEIAIYDDRETALDALKQYSCQSYIESAYVGTVRICEFYFVQEREYDEYGDYDDTGCYEFAEIKEDQ